MASNPMSRTSILGDLVGLEDTIAGGESGGELTSGGGTRRQATSIDGEEQRWTMSGKRREGNLEILVLSKFPLELKRKTDVRQN